MYAQICLGIVFIGMGICHSFKVKIFLRKRLVEELGKNLIEKYQKGLIFPYLMLGIIFITMAIIETLNVLQTPVFIGMYIILAVIPFWMILMNNKKYTDSYTSW